MVNIKELQTLKTDLPPVYFPTTSTSDWPTPTRKSSNSSLLKTDLPLISLLQTDLNLQLLLVIPSQVFSNRPTPRQFLVNLPQTYPPQDHPILVYYFSDTSLCHRTIRKIDLASCGQNGNFVIDWIQLFILFSFSTFICLCVPLPLLLPQPPFLFKSHMRRFGYPR